MNSGQEILILILADLGTDHRCHKIAASLKRLGHHPVVLCDRPLHELGEAWSGYDVRVLTPRSHYRGFLRALLVYLLRITPILLATRSRSWIIEDGTPLFWAALIGKLRGRTVVYDAREILLETPMIRNRPFRRLLWSWWLGAGETLATSLWTVSPAFVRHYRARHRGKDVFLLPNAPMTRADGVARGSGIKQIGGPVTSRIRLIYAGALRPGSGLREALAALAKAPEYDLSIYGFGPEDAELRESAARLGIADRVRFHGAVAFEDLREPIARAHIGLHLLASSCISFDLTLSNKIFDYIHGVTPVLLSGTRAHHEFLREEPVGVEIASMQPEDILAGLAAIRGDYSRLLENCRSAKTRWNWDAFESGMADSLALSGNRS